MPDQAEILENDPDAPPKVGQDIARSVRQILIEQLDPAAGRSAGQVQKLEQGCFPRTGRSGQEIESALCEPEIEVAKYFRPRAVTQTNTVEFDDCRQRPAPPCHPASRMGPPPCQWPHIPVYPLQTKDECCA